jgi:hypothetical protein
MDDQMLATAARDAVTKGNPWQGLAAVLLFLVVLGLRYGLARVAEGSAWWRRAARWLASTHLGGIATSLLCSSIGAAITALAVKDVSWMVVWNAFLTTAVAGFVAALVKAPRKQAEDQAISRARSNSDLLVVAIVGALGFGAALTACTMTNAFRFVDTAASLSRSAYDLLFQIDAEKQRAIAAEADTIGEDAAAEKVAAWRAKVDVGYKALKMFSAAIVTAEATLNLIVAGQEKKITVGVVVAEVAKAVTATKKVLEEFGVKVPFLSVEGQRGDVDALAALSAIDEARAVIVGDATGLRLACAGGGR